MRNSRQRNIIRQVVSNRYDHPTATVIYEAARLQDSNISLGTVYRNLSQMAQRGEIVKINSPDGVDRFDWQCHPHSHFFCKSCGALSDFDVILTPNQIRGFHKLHGGHLESIQLIGIGYCEKCKLKKEEICQN